MRKNSIKNTRVNAEVQRELSNILRAGIKDPRVAPMTSVVAVEVAPDLKTCKAYISVLGDEKAQQDTIRGLQSAEGYIRRELARTINMRNTPEIRFIVDQSIEYGVNISKKIDEVTRDLKDGADEQQQVDGIVSMANKQAADIFREMLKPILKVIDTASDMDELQAVLKDETKLKKLYGQMESPELDDMIQQGIYLSHLVGRSMD